MKLTDKQARHICKVGQGKDCCAFLMMGPRGWECGKADFITRGIIEARLKANTMNAQGVGDWEDCLCEEK